MLAQRWFYYPKPGCLDEMWELMNAEMQRFSSPHPRGSRLYSWPTGNSAQVAMELEFESHEASDKFWTAWAADPGAAAWFKKHNKMAARYWTREDWELAE